MEGARGGGEEQRGRGEAGWYEIPYCKFRPKHSTHGPSKAQSCSSTASIRRAERAPRPHRRKPKESSQTLPPATSRTRSKPRNSIACDTSVHAVRTRPRAESHWQLGSLHLWCASQPGGLAPPLSAAQPAWPASTFPKPRRATRPAARPCRLHPRRPKPPLAPSRQPGTYPHPTVCLTPSPARQPSG